MDISVVRPGPGCTASRPLFVVLRNPEGRWIRTYSVSRERTAFRVSGVPGYYLEIRAADSGCFALLYGLTIISQAVRLARIIRSQDAAVRAAAETMGSDDALLCRIAHHDRVRVAVRIRKRERRRRSLRSRAARRRYARHVKRERPKLARARANERRACAKVG